MSLPNETGGLVTDWQQTRLQGVLLALMLTGAWGLP